MALPLRYTASKLLKKQKNLTAVVRKKSSVQDENVLKSVYKDIPKTNYTVNDFVWQNLDRWPDKTAMVSAVTGHGYTYAQTHKMSIVFAASLRTKLKLRNDDKVAIILPNVPEYPCVLLGVLEAGCVASMMNPAYTAHELKRQLELIDCKAIITSNVSYANVKEALNNIKTKIPVICVDNTPIDGVIKFAEFAEDYSIDTNCLKSVKRSHKDVAILPFSSGTTGFPKGVVLTHESVVALNLMISEPELVAVEETTDTYQSVLPGILPFFHIFGFNASMLDQLYFGCKVITMPYFKPDLFLQTIVNNKANVIFVVPPMVVFLGKHPAVKPEHLDSLRVMVSGAAPISEADAEAVIKKNNKIGFRQGYGLTETNGGISIGTKHDKNYSSVGHLFGSCEVKIADFDTNESLGPGKEGEIWCRGPNLMSGYYKNEKATKEVMTEDGWYKTGDIGKYDEKKYLYVTDRLKELIKVKGFQVPPAELEALLRTHPKILDCAVLGIPDPISGEVPKAFLVPQPGQEVDVEEIKSYVNEKVASFKKIHEVQIIEEIPKNQAGKILRKDLKAKYC